MHILFVTSTRIGDAVLSTGVLKHLIECHPGAKVTVVAGPVAAPLFAAVPGLERLIVLRKKKFSFHWLPLWADVVRRRWDILVDLRHAPLMRLVFARERHHMGRSPKVAHRVREIADVLGIEETVPAPKLWVNDENRARATRLIDGDGPVLAIGPVANWGPKTWPPERFAELVARLSASDGILPGARVAVFGHSSERQQAAPVLAALPADMCIDLVGDNDLLDVAACLQRCALFIGNDSGLMHMAAALGVPTLGLFGPSRDELYAPWGPHGAFVRGPGTYDDLMAGRSPRDIGDENLMTGLSVDAVEAAARALWQKVGEKAA